ncbi:MAG: hypothetical protein ABR592_10975 [Nitriliruptorales bacterium]
MSWKTVVVSAAALFILYTVYANPESVADALRNGWGFVRGFAAALGRIVDTL